MTNFQSFGLAPRVESALTAAGYSTPTPIQAGAIPLIMSGRDVMGLAQTGTGKTLAFAAPILDKLFRNQGPAPHKGTRVLVLAPTRELAGQIAASFETYGAGLGLRIAMVCGGAKIGPQIRKLERGVHVLIATPGRLIDLIEQRAVGLKNVEVLVLDEADQMLDLGFIHALRAIAKHVPAKRQTLFFSATMPKLVEGLAAQFLRDPAQVAVAPPSATADKVEQRICFVEQGEKQALLVETIRKPEVKTVLVFTRTKHGADAVVRRLAASDIDSVAIHGNKSQSQRERALEAFKGGKVPVLVATDIAARGIHIDNLTHVINFDLPEVPEQYVHRIGRTARAGASGVAISFVSKDERDYLRAIEKLIGNKLAPRPAGEKESDDRGSRKPQQQSRRPQGQSRSSGNGERRPQRDGERRAYDPAARRPQADGERRPQREGERTSQGNGERTSSGNGGHFQRTSGGGKPGGHGGGSRRGPGQGGGGNRSRRPERAGV
ncbi:MAG: DEAD/DEAH box helicase [Hyphomonas sp.]|nr:DEAD/DEAH box helicase [Hyphomonas sp.]